MASQDMDPETEALIARLIASDLGEGSEPADQQYDHSDGDYEDPSELYEHGSGEAGPPEHLDDSDIPAWNPDSADGQYIGETGQTHPSATTETAHKNDDLLEEGGSLPQADHGSSARPEVVDGVVDPLESEEVRKSSAKGKGKASDQGLDDEANDGEPPSAEEDEEKGTKDSNSCTSSDEESDCPDEDRKYAEDDEHEFDFLFEPCHRTWNPELGMSTLNVKIPWSFVAPFLGIVPEESEHERRNKRRYRSLGLENPGAYDDAVEVHEIILSDAEDDGEGDDDDNDSGHADAEAVSVVSDDKLPAKGIIDSFAIANAKALHAERTAAIREMATRHKAVAEDTAAISAPESA